MLETPTPSMPSKEHALIKPPAFSFIDRQTVALPKPPIEDDERLDRFSIADRVFTHLDERKQRDGLVVLFLQMYPWLRDDTPIRKEFGDIVNGLLESDGSISVLSGDALEAARDYFETIGTIC